MTRLDHLPASLQAALVERRLLKVIAGLTNFDAVAVERIARAAGRGGADLLDVACDPQLVSLAAGVSGLPICVSAVDAELFPAAVAAGAAMVEIGNYDAFYPLGRVFGAEEVLAICRRTRELLPDVVLSVTVPHLLPLDQQEQLALDLAAAGADINFVFGSAYKCPEGYTPLMVACHRGRCGRAVDGSYSMLSRDSNMV